MIRVHFLPGSRSSVSASSASNHEYPAILDYPNQLHYRTAQMSMFRKMKSNQFVFKATAVIAAFSANADGKRDKHLATINKIFLA
jgi:hypothetical protein